jgi:hypothetical protein
MIPGMLNLFKTMGDSKIINNTNEKTKIGFSNGSTNSSANLLKKSNMYVLFFYEIFAVNYNCYFFCKIIRIIEMFVVISYF